jgi:hypothetical protein
MLQPPFCVCRPSAPDRSLSYSCLRSCQDEVLLGQLRSEPSLNWRSGVFGNGDYSSSAGDPASGFTVSRCDQKVHCRREKWTRRHARCEPNLIKDSWVPLTVFSEDGGRHAGHDGRWTVGMRRPRSRCMGRELLATAHLDPIESETDEPALPTELTA